MSKQHHEQSHEPQCHKVMLTAGVDSKLYYSKFAKDRYHINPIQKKLENMYLMIDSSDINSVFSIQLQNE